MSVSLISWFRLHSEWSFNYYYLLYFIILQNLYYTSVQKKAGNSNQDLIHAATLLFRNVMWIQTGSLLIQTNKQMTSLGLFCSSVEHVAHFFWYELWAPQWNIVKWRSKGLNDLIVEATRDWDELLFNESVKIYLILLAVGGNCHGQEIQNEFSHKSHYSKVQKYEEGKIGLHFFYMWR